MATRDERLARVRRATDREFGDPVRVTPMRTGTYAAMPDPARDVFEIAGKLDVGTGKTTRLDGTMAAAFDATIPLNEAELRVDLSTHPDAATVKVGDVVDTLSPERTTQTRYSVGRIDRGQLNRLVFRLTAL